MRQPGLHPDETSRDKLNQLSRTGHRKFAVQRLHEQRERRGVFAQNVPLREREHDDPSLGGGEHGSVAHPGSGYRGAVDEVIDHGDGGIRGLSGHDSTVSAWWHG